VKHLIERHGFLAAGIDSSLPMLMLGQKCLPLIRAEAENLPFRDGEWDGVLAECTLSVTGAPDIAFRECARVLRRGGKLILSDVYLKNSKAVPEARALQAVCQFARAPAQEELMSRLEKAGCQVLAWEDHSAALKHFAAQLILSGEAGPPSLRVPTGPQPSDDTEIEQAASFAWLGYFLAVAMKSLNG
jgi:SAM-dependent methyltransferase